MLVEKATTTPAPHTFRPVPSSALLPGTRCDAPDVMRSCSMALQLLSTAVGSYMGGGLVAAVTSAAGLVAAVTSAAGHPITSRIQPHTPPPSTPPTPFQRVEQLPSTTVHVALCPPSFLQAPDVMRSCSMALQLFSTAVGSYMGGGLVAAVAAVTSAAGHPPLPSPTPTHHRTQIQACCVNSCHQHPPPPHPSLTHTGTRCDAQLQHGASIAEHCCGLIHGWRLSGSSGSSDKCCRPPLAAQGPQHRTLGLVPVAVWGFDGGQRAVVCAGRKWIRIQGGWGMVVVC